MSLIKTLSIIHAFMCLTLVVFGSFAYIENKNFLATTDYNDVFIYVVPILAMAGYFGSKFVYQNLLQKLPKDEPLSKKMQHYQIASLIKYALIEGPAFLALGIYYIDGNALYLVIGLSLLVYLFFQRPTLAKLKNELRLRLQEEREIDTMMS